MDTKHRQERSPGGGIWITERQLAWIAGFVAAFSLVLAGVMALPNFVTTKEQGANMVGDVANLQQLYLTNRQADVAIQNQLITNVATVVAQQKVVNEKLDEAIKKNSDFMKWIESEHDTSVKDRQKLRADVDFLLKMPNNKSSN